MCGNANRERVCSSCNKPAGEDGHLCVPVEKGDQKCDWCGSIIPSKRHVCESKVKDISYICNSCGRTAVKAEHLCNPEKIK